MTSAINTSGINTGYPVAGVNNSTQGFRDNFNSIKQNLNTAGNEITDLQNKAILKSGITGQTLNNDMSGGSIANVLTSGYRGAGINLGTNLQDPGVPSIDVNVADVYYGTILPTANVTLAFTKWAPAGTLSEVRVILTGNTTVASTIVLPPEVDGSRLNLDNIISSNVSSTDSYKINTLSQYPVYDLLFSTVDCGTTLTVTPYNQSRKADQIINRPGLTTVGLAGDVVGSIAYSQGNVWICSANYDGANVIWNQLGSGNGGGATYQLVNGSSNVVVAANANVTISSAGTANVLTINPTTTTLKGNLVLSNGSINANFITATGNIATTTNLQAANANILNNLTIGGTLTIGSFTSTGTVTLGNVITGNITASGNTTVTGNVSGANIIASANVITPSLKLGSNTAIAPNPSANSVSYVLPVNAGSTNQVLTTDGTGNLTWATPGNANVNLGFNNQLVINAVGSNTFTVPSDVSKIKVTVVGGGGNGGNATFSSVFAAAGGGGSGSTVVSILSVSPNANISYTVGNSGASSTFGSTIAATPGVAGVNAVGNISLGGNGAPPPTAPAGSLIISGGDGDNGGSVSGGHGGASSMGDGGRGSLLNGDGANGRAYGSGGGGAYSTTDLVDPEIGGFGAQGVIIIEY